MREMILKTPIEKLGNFGFRVRLPEFPLGDHLENTVASRLYIFEDGKQFGTPHIGGANVMAHGKGQYIHWDHTLLFSTNDNSDPNTNGRTYKIVWDDELYYEERAAYFYTVLLDKMKRFGGDFRSLAGKSLLEVGCGRHHGMCLLAVGYGANVVALDRYAPTWDEEFHPGFLDFLMRKGAALWSGFDPSPFRAMLEAKGFVQSPFVFFPTDAEALASCVDTSFDYHCSHAALEHFYDVEGVIKMLWDTAKPGSVGSHVVDFRDHRNFAKPFEFFLMTDEEYDELCGDEKYIHGNRVRPMTYKKLFEKYGFNSVEMIDLDCDLDEGYLHEFVTRLRASPSRFADESEDTLRRLSINYVVRKP